MIQTPDIDMALIPGNVAAVLAGDTDHGVLGMCHLLLSVYMLY